MMKAAPAVLAALCALAIAGPSAAQDFRDAAVAQCRTDNGAHWIDRSAKLSNLLILGPVADPASTGGALTPTTGYSFFGGGLQRWLTDTGLPSVDQYIDPTLPPGTTDRIGPKAGEPKGVYRFTKAAITAPRCADYRAVSGPPVMPPGQCVYFDYVGPLDVSKYDFIEVNYHDAKAKAAGYDRFVNELRDTKGKPVVRMINYVIPGRLLDCPATMDVLTGILDRSAKGR